MSDHYCCKQCHQRYDHCNCGPVDSIFKTVGTLKAKPAEVFETTDQVRMHRVKPGPETNVLLFGYGNLGKQTTSLFRKWSHLSSKKWNITLVEVDSAFKGSFINGYTMYPISKLIQEPELLSQYGTIILCIPSENVFHWADIFGQSLTSHRVISRTTLPLEFPWAVKLTHFAYVPEFATEHAMEKNLFDIDCYSASSSVVDKTVQSLFGSHWRKLPFKSVAATKLLRNAAQAVNAVYHNTALSMMREHGINPSHINTYEWLDTGKRLPHRERRLPRGLMFGGRCLRPSLDMLPSHAPFWSAVAKNNDESFYEYVLRLERFITSVTPEGKEFKLVVSCLNYHASEATSSYKHSVAQALIHGLQFRRNLVLRANPKSTVRQLNELKAELTPADVLQPKEVADGVILVQPATNKDALIRAVLPPRRKTKAGEVFSPFYVFDPLMQVYPVTIAKLQAATNRPLQLIHKIE